MITLNAAPEENDQKVFLLALRDITEARGFSRLAQDASLNRENLYRMLSPAGKKYIWVAMGRQRKAALIAKIGPVFGRLFGQRRWKLLLRKAKRPNNPCSRRWRDASQGYLTPLRPFWV